MYYKRFELQWRLSLFFSGSILAGAFGGLLAYALASMAGVANYGGWRWIFIIEGIITVVIAALGKLAVVDWPSTAKFLNDDERAALKARLYEDDKGTTMNRLDKRSLKRIFSDWKIYVGMAMYFGVVNTGYAGSVSDFIRRRSALLGDVSNGSNSTSFQPLSTSLGIPRNMPKCSAYPSIL
jgi:MFS family permease